MTYIEQEKLRAAAWKNSTSALPGEAKAPAGYVNKDGVTGSTPYDFCLPPELASHSLLADIREPALALFAELGIPWHAGVNGGPSNHLLSSQVQCVNALAQTVSDPDRLKLAFGELLGIDEVLEIEPGRFLTFEYIGAKDYLSEARNGQRVRGAHCTSVDAAFLHRAVDGVVELVLVEWKYTESYRLRKPDPEKDAVRLGRYGKAVADPTGPVRGDLLAFELLLDEPFYQLVRQQLLAHALERDGAEGAGRVRVVHVLPPDNAAYQQSLARLQHRALGETVGEVWHKLLRHTDRFISVDSKIFCDPQITSREYVLRYCDRVAYSTQALLAMVGVRDAQELEDALDFHGHIELYDDSIDLVIGQEGTGFTYPFHLNELRDLADELQAGDG
jgi:hypothetical protein